MNASPTMEDVNITVQTLTATLAAPVTLDIVGTAITWTVQVKLKAFIELQLYPTITEIDECSTNNGGCEHDCDNNDGSFLCSCDSGYQLDNNSLNCSGTMCRSNYIHMQEFTPINISM